MWRFTLAMQPLRDGATQQQILLILLLVNQLILCVDSIHNNGISVSMLTDPSGPAYPAASWIRITCQRNESELDTTRYTWIGACNGTGERIFEIHDPYLDSEGKSVVWIPSTPHYCLDYVECRVLDVLTKDEGVASLLITDIYGVGVAIEDQFLGTIPNNSILINRGSHTNVLCHSASKTACSGQWFTPAGESIAVTGNETSDCKRTSLLYSYVNLTIVQDQKASGVYTCTIKDKNDILQSVYTGIYSSVQEVEREAERVVVKLNYNKIDDAGDITFVCSSEGLPVTFTTWKKDSFNASQYDDVDQVNVLVHPLSSSYNSELTIHNTNLTSLQDCTLMCDIYTEWVMSDQSEYGRQHVMGQFVIKKVGDMAALECIFPPNHNNTQWILPDLFRDSKVSILTPFHALLTFLVTDVLHETTFLCQALTPKGNYVYKHYMLITYVPEDAIVMAITEHSYTNEGTVAAPDHHNISCCVSINVEGITSAPTVNWHNSHGELISNGGDFHLQQTVAENHYCTLFQFPSEACGDRLLCKAILFYDADSMVFEKTMKYSIIRTHNIELDGQEEMSSSVLIIAGATVTIVSVGILAIILTALSCTVICKKRQLEVPELDLQGQAGKRDEGYQSESFTSEVIDVKT